MIQVESDGRRLEIALRRTSRRNSIALEVRPDGARVLAPKRLPVRDIRAFVASRSDWIEAKFAELERTGRAPGPRSWASGETFAWRGEIVRLEVGRRLGARRLEVGLEGARLRVEAPEDVSAERVANAVRRFYAREARALFESRLPAFEERIGRSAAGLRITHARRRWGSCDARGVLRLAARLAMAPDYASDYVLIHELCHLWEMNHGAAFWDRVERAMPDWRERERALGRASALCVL